MDDQTHSVVRAIDQSPDVVLLLVDDEHRATLADQLSEADITVVSDDTSPLPPFDVCIVDTESYPAVGEQLRRRKADADPVLLPVLLVLEPGVSETRARELVDDIDDFLTLPTTERLLLGRIRAHLQARRQSKHSSLFRRAMDKAVNGITIADAGDDEKLVYANDAFLETTGYEREEVLGRNCRFLQGPDTDRSTVEEIRAALDSGTSVEVEILNYRKDGSEFWNHLSVTPVFENGDLTHYLGFQQDVTDRIERSRELNRYEEIVRAAGDPIYSLDADLRVTLLNEATARFSETDQADLVGRHVREVFGAPHAAQLADAILSLANDDQMGTTIETAVTDAKGRKRRYQTALAVMPADEFDGVVCVSRDVTEHREREYRLSVLDRVLRHNLRNKLHVVLAQAELAREQTDDEAIRNATTTIERAAEELLNLGETARAFHDTLDPRWGEEVSAVDVATHTRHVVDEARLSYEDAAFVTDIPGTLWARTHNAFELAMSEILDNAATYGGDGVEVAVTLETTGDDETVVVTVADDGPGIPDVEKDALTSGVESDLQHTSGLGLWFVRWLAINSGGSFTIDDNDPAGAVVELRLPVAAPPEEEVSGQ
ncbi:PAS domain S-box protein [Haloarcula marina]|uniref:PAS domain S-box protein n=1 Tax=Haloarcula marina TaxID=2961574 RepID=UPI0020B690A3|nr:PAS domain S-box protein [Halomicroarcula marina]